MRKKAKLSSGDKVVFETEFVKERVNIFSSSLLTIGVGNGWVI